MANYSGHILMDVLDDDIGIDGIIDMHGNIWSPPVILPNYLGGGDILIDENIKIGRVE